MANPQGGFPPQAYPGQGEHAQQQYDQAEYQEPSSPSQATGPGAAAHAGRKKRAYAGQAYEFGAGANSALGGQQQAGGSYGGQAPGYGAYPQPSAAGYQQPSYGADQHQPAPISSPPYGQADMAGVGGYQPPAASYPAPATSGGVGGVTQQFGQMSVGDKQQPPQAAQPRMALNQLYPTDLVNQPLNVAELDYPPPPIVLPPNVSLTRSTMYSPRSYLYRLALPLRQTPTALRSTSDQL